MSFDKLLAAVVAALVVQAGAAAAQNLNAAGRWSGLIGLPLVPSSGAVLKDGKVLLWSADGEFSFANGGVVNSTLFDPVTLANSRKNGATGQNMFCTGTTMLADGRVLANGGSSPEAVSIYNPDDRSFSRAQNMAIPRGYNGNTILPDGTVLTVGGSWSNGSGRKDGEIFTPGVGWRFMPGIDVEGWGSPYDGSTTGRDSHWNVIPGGNGRVLYAAPHPTMRWVDTTGSGSVKVAGRRGDDDYATSSTTVMYDAGRILKAGGSQTYSGTPASARAYDIDIRSGTPNVTKLASMVYPRVYHNSVVLPDGKVMLVGGQTYGQGFSDANSVFPTEIWDPKTGSFAVTAPIAVGRNYHSIALLLPDGRVLSGGGGLCGNCSANHPDVQLYSPGYLFDANGAAATRPSIVSAPDVLGYGRPITVTTDRPVTAFSLVRMGATTHSVNTDQRRLSLAFSRTGGNVYRVETPSNAGYLLPGYWMLFALDGEGVPSVAKVVRVDVNGIAQMVAPEPVASRMGAPVSIRPNVTKLSGATRFSAIGLPNGLSVDPVTGEIGGSPSTFGSYKASLVATLGDQSVSTDFVVAVDPPPSGGDGLLGEYFSTTNLTGAPALARREAVDFDFGGASPGPGVPAAFSARWTGKLRASRGGVTRFRTTSDDGVRLWIGGKLIVDNWTSHGATLDEGQIELSAGSDHDVFLEYYNGGGASALRLAWLRPGDADFAAVPASELFSGAAPSTANVALGKPATQSSTFEGAAAARAADGDVNGVYSGRSVSHTDFEDNPWLQVDLGSRMAIDFVRIWKRTDCCADRIQNVTVFIADADPTGRTFASLMSDPAVVKRSYGPSSIFDHIDVPLRSSGRYVRVQSGVRTFLHLAELQAFGAPANGAPSIAAVAAQSGRTGERVSLALAASDPDGDALRFTAQDLPPGLSVASSTGVISGVPTATGTFDSSATATDGDGLSASVAIRWNIERGVPRVTRLVVRPARVGVTVRYAPTIENGEGAAFSWSFGDGSADTSFSSSPDADHVFARAGVFGVTLNLRAADGQRTTYNFDQAAYVRPAADARGASSAGAGYEARPGGSPRLWVANPDNDSVAVLDLGANTRVAEIAVGRSPQSVAIAPDGRVWVTNRDSATISILDPTTLAVARTVSLPAASQPFGLVFADGGAVVTLEALGEAALVSADGSYAGSAPVGPFPRFLATNEARDRVYVSRFVTGPQPGEGTAVVAGADAAGRPTGGELRVVRLDGAIERTIVLKHSTAADSEASGRGVPNYLGAAALAPDGRFAWVPSKQDNIARGTLRDGRNLDFQNTVRAIVSKVDLTTGLEDLSSRVDLDNSGVASAAAMHPTGAYLFVALQTSRQVAVVSPAGKRELFRFAVGRAPSTLTLSPDGLTLYVGNFMDRTVSVVKLQPLLGLGQKRVIVAATIATVGEEKLSPQVLKGKQLFYDAADRRLARDGYMSCASCHDRGEGDGRTWDFTGFGEGLRNTTALVGRAGMGNGFLHWSANFNEVQDFEGQIRGFAGGTGLMSNAAFAAATRSQPLGSTKAGASADLDALAAYLNSLTAFPPSPYAAASGALTRSGPAGKAAFDRSRCASCHAGPEMTISDNANRLKDVGTIKPSSGKRLGAALPGIDVPTLRGAWATAPYLHDGSAATLEAAVRAHRGVAIPYAEIDALVDYLRQIGPAQ